MYSKISFNLKDSKDHVEEMEYDVEVLVGIAHWLTGIGTVLLAVVLIKTF